MIADGKDEDEPRRHEGHQGVTKENRIALRAKRNNLLFFVNPFVFFVSSWLKNGVQPMAPTPECPRDVAAPPGRG